MDPKSNVRLDKAIVLQVTFQATRLTSSCCDHNDACAVICTGLAVLLHAHKHTPIDYILQLLYKRM